MPEFVATTPGLFPLPDWAKESLSDLKGHQRGDLIDGDEPEAVAEVYDEARREVVDRQVEAGLGRVVEGQLRWDDMLVHPLAVHDAVETRGLRRYYDNNNFYREPVVTGPLDADGDVAAELSAAADLAGDLQAVLPGPYSLYDLATDAHYGDDEEFLGAIGAFLAGEAASFPEVDTLFLLEPSLVTREPGTALGERVGEAVEAVGTATDAEVVVHTYWGAPDADTYGRLLDAGVDGVGLDLVSAPDACSALVADHGAPATLALGVVDGQNTRVESAATVRQRAGEFLDATDADVARAYLTSNTELFYLPGNRFEEKLATLAEAAAPEAAA